MLESKFLHLESLKVLVEVDQVRICELLPISLLCHTIEAFEEIVKSRVDRHNLISLPEYPLYEASRVIQITSINLWDTSVFHPFLISELDAPLEGLRGLLLILSF